MSTVNYQIPQHWALLDTQSMTASIYKDLADSGVEINISQPISATIDTYCGPVQVAMSNVQIDFITFTQEQEVILKLYFGKDLLLLFSKRTNVDL
jgi:hypothetical protein